MAIKMNQGLNLGQSQNLMMTPQLQQAIKLLTLTHLEMTSVIAQEMVENPMLEEAGGELSKEEYVQQQSEDRANAETTSDSFSGPELVEGGKEDFDWEKYVEGYNNTSSSPRSASEYGTGEDMPNYENMVSKNQSLPEHLEWQLRMENLTTDEIEFALKIVHNIDDDGYFEISKEELYKDNKIEREDAEELVKMVQNLDPVGCATWSLSECLMVQARAVSDRSPLVEKLILNHMDDLQSKNYEKISKVLGLPIDKVKDAEMVVLSFHPKPGRLVSPEETQYVVPDIFVHEVGGEFVIAVNDEGVPRLKISNLYKSLMTKSADNDPAAKEYVMDKLRAAKWLIKSIETRQSTILKVAQAIVKYQQQFFKKGSAYLKPMILKDIAMEIEMHESTVSRVTTNKFMHTPIGTFELKYFFNAGIGGKNGGIDIAGETLKLKIKQLIDNEDTKKPLSDQKVADLLKTNDVVVARRTIAKYREMMNIPATSERKKK